MKVGYDKDQIRRMELLALLKEFFAVIGSPIMFTNMAQVGDLFFQK